MYGHERSLVKEMQGRPFVLLGVNTDESVDRARKAISKNNLNWRSFYDGSPGSGPITQQFQISGYPTIMLIDHQGVIRFPSIRQNLDETIEELVVSAEADGMVGERRPNNLRTWRDKTGEHKIRARAEAGDSESVRLRKEDGSAVVVRRDQLSKADQRHLQMLSLEPLDATDPDGWRTFRDRTGKFEVEARMVETRGDKVILEKRDGSTIDVPLEKLSDTDQEYVGQQR